MSEVVARHPAVPRLTEVFHAHFTDHVYPAHTHDAWTLLLVDDGAVRYDLDRHAHGATTSEVTLLLRGFRTTAGRSRLRDSGSGCPTWSRRRWVTPVWAPLSTGRRSTTPCCGPDCRRCTRCWAGGARSWRRRAGWLSCWSVSVSTWTARSRPPRPCGTTCWPTRHCRRVLGTTPPAYARSGRT